MFTIISFLLLVVGSVLTTSGPKDRITPINIIGTLMAIVGFVVFALCLLLLLWRLMEIVITFIWINAP